MKFSYVILCLFFSLQRTEGQSILYIHQDIPKEQIAEQQHWQTFNKPVYNGFDNGVYWFKIQLPPTAVTQVISIPESHISRAWLYKDGKALQCNQKLARYISFELPPSAQPETYYLKVDCLLEARIPLEVKPIKAHYQNELIEYWIIGLYIGIILSIIILNIFSYLNFRNKTYIHYVFMVIGMGTNAFYKDGITALIFGLQGINETLEPIINTIVTISAIFFTTSYLQLENYPETKTVKRTGIFFVFICLLLNVFFQLTGSYLIFTLVAIFNLLALDCFWFTSVLLWKKSNYARFFCIAYGLPLLLAHHYYISPHFGILSLNLPLNAYKIGSAFEMIIFTYAIMYQARQLKKENKKMRRKIDEYILLLKDKSTKVAFEEDLVLNHNFTSKEMLIFKALSLKKTNKQIAKENFISENTVKFHIKNIFKKLEVKSRSEVRERYFKN